MSMAFSFDKYHQPSFFLKIEYRSQDRSYFPTAQCYGSGLGQGGCSEPRMSVNHMA